MSRIVKHPLERKEELLQIGLELFLQGGIKNISISKVVKKADVATGLFYYYFVSKDDFIEQSMQMYIDKCIFFLESIVNNKSVSVYDRLQLLLNEFESRCDSIELIIHTNHIDSRIIDRLHNLITTFIEEGNKTGSFKTLESSVTALYLVSGVTYVIQRSNLSSISTREEIKRLVFTALSINNI